MDSTYPQAGHSTRMVLLLVHACTCRKRDCRDRRNCESSRFSHPFTSFPFWNDSVLRIRCKNTTKQNPNQPLQGWCQKNTSLIKFPSLQPTEIKELFITVGTWVGLGALAACGVFTTRVAFWPRNEGAGNRQRIQPSPLLYEPFDCQRPKYGRHWPRVSFFTALISWVAGIRPLKSR